MAVEAINIEDSPLVLGVPSHFMCFFGGPLFPGTHDDKLREHYQTIETPFDILKNTERKKNLCRLLCYINPAPGLFTGESNLSHLLSEVLQQKHLYQRWKQEVDGKERTFCVPQKAFKEFLMNYVLPFVKHIPAHEASHGSEKGWSVRTSLEYHLPVSSSLTFDMENATNQATMNYVFGFFYDALEGRYDEEEQRRDVAVFLSAVCTIREKYDSNKSECFEANLPQGSQVSSAIFNRMLYPIDCEFSRFARKKGIKYSRWFDDFIFTSEKQSSFDDFAYVMRKAQESFNLSPHKVFFKHRGFSYILGHRVSYNAIEKLSKEEFEKQRGNPYTGWFLSDTHPQGGFIYQEDEESPPEGIDEAGPEDNIPF